MIKSIYEKIIKNENGIVFQNLFFNLETGETLSPIKTANYEIVQVADSYFIKNRICEEHKQRCDIEITFSVYNEVFSGTNLSEVTEMLGYTNTANFSRAFKKRFGISPGEYKKLYTKD